MSSYATVSDLLGKTLIAVELSKDRESLSFLTDEGEHYVMLHIRDCCESVHLEDVSGDLRDLEGTPILKAEVSTDSEGGYAGEGSSTWTYYLISTMKGDVSLRWFGSSNGYYSESVDFRLLETGDDLHQLEF